MSPRTNLSGRHLMIDGETLGTGSDCTFLQLAAVEFWPSEPARVAERCFNAYITMDSSFRARRTVDPGALLWWLSDGDRGAGPEARAQLVEGMQYAISWREALEGLHAFAKAPSGRGLGHRPEGVAGAWSHGAAFDVSRLETAYTDLRLEAPWDFRDQRDTRTLFQMVGSSLGKLSTSPGVKHDALADCRQQVEAVHVALALLEPMEK